MIKKVRQRGLKHMKIEALSRRIAIHHPKRKRVIDDLAKLEAGFKGEKTLNYFFELLTDKETAVFHDLRLPVLNTQHYFQIDTLIATPFFLAIVEVKNIAGNIFIDHLADQMVRTFNGEQEAFQDPVNQAKRQTGHLEKLLQHKQFPALPVEHLACFTNSSSVITFSSRYPEKAKMKVIRPRNLLEKLQYFKSLHPERNFTKSDLKKLTTLLLKSHTENETDVLIQYGILPNELATGVQCPSCLSFPMLRRYDGWRCPNCSQFERDAHIQALSDYALLFKNSISNNEARMFLNLTSSTTVQRILQSMCLRTEGERRTFRYIIRE